MRDTTTQDRRFGLKPFSLLAIEATCFSLFNAYLSQEVQVREYYRSWPHQADAFQLVQEYEKVIKHFKFPYNYYLPGVKLLSCCLPFQITLRCGLLLSLVISYIHVFKVLSRYAYVQSPRCSLDILNNDTEFAAYKNSTPAISERVKRTIAGSTTQSVTMKRNVKMFAQQ
jgi:hypothetical protein